MCDRREREEFKYCGNTMKTDRNSLGDIGVLLHVFPKLHYEAVNKGTTLLTSCMHTIVNGTHAAKKL